VIQQGGATMVYDGNGNRVSKTVAGVTTTFLVSEINPTGYAQVVGESFSGGTGAQEESHAYVYGLDRISQKRQFTNGTQNLTQVSYYVYVPSPMSSGWTKKLWLRRSDLNQRPALITCSRGRHPICKTPAQICPRCDRGLVGILEILGGRSAPAF
jgi:hypothetical protein